MSENPQLSIPRIDGSAPSQGGTADSNSRLIRSILRSWWILALLPLAAGIGMYRHLQTVTPLFRASARMTLDSRDISVVGRDANGANNKQRTYLKQQAAVLKSELILKPLAKRLEGLNLRHFQRDGDDRAVAAILFEGMNARPDNSTDILSVSFDSPFKREAETIVEEIIHVYKDYHRQLKRDFLRDKINILAEERDSSLEVLAEIKQEILQLKRDHPAISTSTSATDNFVAKRLNAVSKALDDAHTEVVHALSLYEALEEAEEDRGELLKYAEDWRSQKLNPALENSISFFVQERQQLESQRAQRLTTMTPDSKIIKSLNARIDALLEKEQDIILEYARAYKDHATIALTEARRKEEKFSEDFAMFESEVYEVNEALETLKLLESRREIAMSAADLFASRIGELEADDESGALVVNVLEPPRASPEPVYPNKLEMMGYATAGAFAIAFAFVLIRGLSDRRVRGVEEIPNLINTSVLSVMPRLATSKRTKIGRIVEKKPGSLAAESVRSLRTAATFGLPSNGKGVIVITSSVSGEGKSTTASNLAIALSKAGRRTLLIDGDLRSPHQGEIFELSDEPGLGNVLRGAIPLKKAISNVAPHLDLLPAGDAEGKAAELLESDECRRLLTSLRERYDCIVMDTSPVLETSESRVIAAGADVCIFVMHLNVSFGSDSQRAAGILRGVGARILGVVANGSRIGRSSKAYAGGIAYGYGGGYGESTQPYSSDYRQSA